MASRDEVIVLEKLKKAEEELCAADEFLAVVVMRGIITLFEYDRNIPSAEAETKTSH